METPTVKLKNLLTPRSQRLINEAILTKEDENLSLWLLTQDAFGWQNWMRDNRLTVEGSAENIVIAAGKAIGWEEQETKLYLSKPDLFLGSAEPACVFKGNQEDSGKGSVVAWAHLFGLNPEFSKQCPKELRKDVVEHINTHRKDNPKVKSTAPVRTKPSKDKDHKESEDSASVTPDLQEPIAIEEGEQQTDAISKNINFAMLGREIIKYKGEENKGSRITEGQAGYKISVNISDNTMRIYSRKRGQEPILVDADGNIDHGAANVSQEDIRHFEKVVQSLKDVESRGIGEKESQLCL